MTVPLVVGNWKMNGSQAECQKLAREIARDDTKESRPGYRLSWRHLLPLLRRSRGQFGIVK